MDLHLQGYDGSARRQFRRALRERVERLPGVEAVGFAPRLPLRLNPRRAPVIPQGYETPEGSNNPYIEFNSVDHGYFEAMGIPIGRGRGFRETDDEETPPVVVINLRFAELFWPGEEPIGKRVHILGRDHIVVGLVKTGKCFTAWVRIPGPTCTSSSASQVLSSFTYERRGTLRTSQTLFGPRCVNWMPRFQLRIWGRWRAPWASPFFPQGWPRGSFPLSPLSHFCLPLWDSTV